MAAVVRRLIEDRLPELVVTGIAHDPHVSHAPARAQPPPWLARRCKASSSPDTYPAKADDRTGSAAACSRTGKRASKMIMPGYRKVNRTR
jgi:hypothetical protein